MGCFQTKNTGDEPRSRDFSLRVKQLGWGPICQWKLKQMVKETFDLEFELRSWIILYYYLLIIFKTINGLKNYLAKTTDLVFVHSLLDCLPNFAAY